MNLDPMQQDQIEREAAHWVAKLSSDQLTVEDRRQFTDWVNAAPDHRKAYFAMRQQWHRLGQAAHQSEKRPSPRARPEFQKLAAAILLAATLALFYPASRDILLADAVTAPGARETLQLPDGSTLYLNTDTAVAVDYTERQRGLKLLRGELEVEVAHDHERPLVVESGPYAVTALGTRFSVANVNDALRVTVFESRVRCTGGDNVMATVDPGQQLVATDDGRQWSKREIDLEDADAWRQGKLVFTDRPLGEVIAEINRYRSAPLFLLNRPASSRPVSGVFDIDKLEASLPTIAESMNLKPIRLGGLLVAFY